MAAQTQSRDIEVLDALTLFDGSSFLDPVTNLPVNYLSGLLPDYVESTSGQFFVDPTNPKRGPFHDADAKHKMYYSRFHKSKMFCGTCHDVSNPVLASLNLGVDVPETQAAATYYHVERTFSEFMLSDYGSGGCPSDERPN